jgi:O-methyltransferase
MVGLARLDDLQACVEAVAGQRIEGDLIEAGSWRGGASILMRATLDALGDRERVVWVADSFQGFPRAPKPAGDGYDLGADLAACDFLAVPLQEVRDSFTRLGLHRGVRFVPGFFEHTLPALSGRRWSVMRLDGDTYDATRLSLEVLYPGLSAGGYVILDDYLQIDPCRAAVDDFRREHGITEPLEPIDWSGARWRRENEPPPSGAETVSVEVPLPPEAVERRPPSRVPAIEEVELRHELERVRARLAAAEGQIERLISSPLRGPGAWLRLRSRRMLRGRA